MRCLRAQVVPATAPGSAAHREACHHVHECGQHGVSRRPRQVLMEPDVVLPESLNVVHGREHRRHLVGNRRELLGRGFDRREARRGDLERAARVQDLALTQAVQAREQLQRTGFHLVHPVGEEGSRSMADVDDAEHRQRGERRPDRRPADACAARKLALGGEAIARPPRISLRRKSITASDLRRRDLESSLMTCPSSKKKPGRRWPSGLGWCSCVWKLYLAGSSYAARPVPEVCSGQHIVRPATRAMVPLCPTASGAVKSVVRPLERRA